MTHLIIKKKNEVFVTVESEQHVYHELSDHFTFEVPGAKFMPQYRNKYWDGKIRLFDMRRNEIYAGLVDRVISFCNRKDYTYEFEGSKFYGLPIEENELISPAGVTDYVKSISLSITKRYYSICETSIDLIFSHIKKTNLSIPILITILRHKLCARNFKCKMI